jgi:hypothetical protein
MNFTKEQVTFLTVPTKEIPLLGSTGIASVYDDRILDQPTGSPLIPFGGERNIYSLIMQISTALNQLTDEIKLLKEEFRARPNVSSSLLNDLNDNKYIVKKPIPIIIEETEEECLARWPEINAFGVGSTISEAILNLKENIIDIYNDFLMRKKSTLGILALNVLEIMKIYIRKNK